MEFLQPKRRRSKAKKKPHRSTLSARPTDRMNDDFTIQGKCSGEKRIWGRDIYTTTVTLPSADGGGYKMKKKKEMSQLRHHAN